MRLFLRIKGLSQVLYPMLLRDWRRKEKKEGGQHIGLSNAMTYMLVRELLNQICYLMTPPVGLPMQERHLKTV